MTFDDLIHLTNGYDITVAQKYGRIYITSPVKNTSYNYTTYFTPSSTFDDIHKFISQKIDYINS